MIDLQLTRFQSDLTTKKADDKRWIYDPFRKKWLVLLPEELVRQLFLQYLIQEKKYNKNFIGIEQQLTVNTLQKRCDILVYDPEINPWLIVECKAPRVKIDDKVLHQIITYNMELQVQYLVLTNGIQTFCGSIDYKAGTYNFLPALPSFPI
ncbi:MAG: type I restriction enzyme HsdR N-terminal domain-containing protein [Bacteroidota bacterium]